MIRTSLYLDTSVISIYFDARDPTLQEQTREFWAALPRFEVYISTLVLDEVLQTRDGQRRRQMLELLEPLQVFEVTPAMQRLALEYQRQGAFTAKHGRDGLHAAAASVMGVDFLLSWNFRHMVRVKTRRLVNLINLQHGYRTLEIVAPPELL